MGADLGRPGVGALVEATVAFVMDVNAEVAAAAPAHR